MPPDPTDVFGDRMIPGSKAVQLNLPPTQGVLGRIHYLRVRVTAALDNGEYIVCSCNKDGSPVPGGRIGYFVQPSELIPGEVVKDEMPNA